MGLLLALLAATVLAPRVLRVPGTRLLLARLRYAVVSLALLSYLVLFHVYEPARNNIGTFGRVFDRLAALYLSVDTNVAETAEVAGASTAIISQAETVSSPYTAITLAWTSRTVFFALSSFTFILMAVSGVAWVVLAGRFLRRRVARSDLPLFLVWLCAAATTVQVLVSVAADFAGVLGGNLQLRLFPPFVLFATPLAVSALNRLPMPLRLPWLGRLPTFRWATIRVAAAAALAVLTVAAVLKATNDPLVSNQWTFFNRAEALAMRWADTRLVGQSIWGEFDVRIVMANRLIAGDDAVFPEGAIWRSGARTAAIRYVLVSDATVERAARIGAVLPLPAVTDRVYDNGTVAVHHLVPDTPYQA
jgi:hypothetical protein